MWPDHQPLLDRLESGLRDRTRHLATDGPGRDRRAAPGADRARGDPARRHRRPADGGHRAARPGRDQRRDAPRRRARAGPRGAADGGLRRPTGSGLNRASARLDAKHGVATRRRDDGLRLGRLEEAHAAPHLLKECPEDRLALRHRQLDEGDGLGVPAACQRALSGRADVPDPVSLGERRHDVALVIERDDRDRRTAERPARASRGGQEVLRTDLQAASQDRHIQPDHPAGGGFAIRYRPPTSALRP